MSGPLTGLQIIEMAGIGPGPLAGQLLADLGADVIVIDRAVAPVDKTDINRRGKRSIVLDLKTENGRITARQLINRAGIVIEGFRPGVMERLGLGPADLDAHVIFGRITGWGQEGPLSQTSGHDINYLSLTGALAAMGTSDQSPMPPLNFVADYAGGTMFLLLGLLSAVYERQHSGQGQVIDAAMVDGVPALMGLFHHFLAQGDWTLDRQKNLLDGGAPFYRCYRTADDKFISVGPLEPQFHAILLEKANLPREHQQTQNDRATWAEKCALYEKVFSKHTQAEWCLIFEGTDACVAPVLNMAEAPLHPHMAARHNFSVIDSVLQAMPAPRFSRSQTNQTPKPAAPGAHTEEILAELQNTKD